jgi:hypothetical protein
MSSSVTFWKREAGGGPDPDWAAAIDVDKSAPVSAAMHTVMVAQRMGTASSWGIVPLPETIGRRTAGSRARNFMAAVKGKTTLALLIAQLYGRQPGRMVTKRLGGRP